MFVRKTLLCTKTLMVCVCEAAVSHGQCTKPCCYLWITLLLFTERLGRKQQKEDNKALCLKHFGGGGE
jgi:hypothetical protein